MLFHLMLHVPINYVIGFNSGGRVEARESYFRRPDAEPSEKNCFKCFGLKVDSCPHYVPIVSSQAGARSQKQFHLCHSVKVKTKPMSLKRNSKELPLK